MCMSQIQKTMMERVECGACISTIKMRLSASRSSWVVRHGIALPQLTPLSIRWASLPVPLHSLVAFLCLIGINFGNEQK